MLTSKLWYSFQMDLLSNFQRLKILQINKIKCYIAQYATARWNFNFNACLLKLKLTRLVSTNDKMKILRFSNWLHKLDAPICVTSISA